MPSSYLGEVGEFVAVAAAVAPPAPPPAPPPAAAGAQQAAAAAIQTQALFLSFPHARVAVARHHPVGVPRRHGPAERGRRRAVLEGHGDALGVHGLAGQLAQRPALPAARALLAGRVQLRGQPHRAPHVLAGPAVVAGRAHALAGGGVAVAGRRALDHVRVAGVVEPRQAARARGVVARGPAEALVALAEELARVPEARPAAVAVGVRLAVGRPEPLVGRPAGRVEGQAARGRRAAEGHDDRRLARRGVVPRQRHARDEGERLVGEVQPVADVVKHQRVRPLRRHRGAVGRHQTHVRPKVRQPPQRRGRVRPLEVGARLVDGLRAVVADVQRAVLRVDSNGERVDERRVGGHSRVGLAGDDHFRVCAVELRPVHEPVREGHAAGRARVGPVQVLVVEVDGQALRVAQDGLPDVWGEVDQRGRSVVEVGHVDLPVDRALLARVAQVHGPLRVPERGGA